MHRRNKSFFVYASLFIFLYASPIKIPKGFGVDFYDSMSCVRKNFEKFLSNPDWQKVIQLYDSCILTSFNCDQIQRIPKIIHQIWLGSPLPEKYKKFKETWMKMHPGWQYKLWTDTDVEALELKNQKQYDASTNWGQKSDIARYEILNRFGGLYVDIDFECLKPFDIFHYCCDFYAGVTYGPNFALYNGLIGVSPGHPIIKACIEKINIHKKYHKNPIVNILYTSGPYFFTNIYKNFINTQTAHNSIVFPVGYFYPWPNTYRNESKRKDIEKWFRPETFAVHHWCVSWNDGIAPGTIKKDVL